MVKQDHLFTENKGWKGGQVRNKWGTSGQQVGDRWETRIKHRESENHGGNRIPD